MNPSIFNELLIRIKSKSPKLFLRLQIIFFSLAAAVVVLIFLKPLNLNLHGLEVYVNWNTFVVLLSFGGVSLLPVNNPEVLVKKKTLGEGDDEGGDHPTKPPGTPDNPNP